MKYKRKITNKRMNQENDINIFNSQNYENVEVLNKFKVI